MSFLPYKNLGQDLKIDIKFEDGMLPEKNDNFDGSTSYHFESIKEYNAYDKMCRKRATDEAIRRIVAEKMAGTDE